MKCFLDCTVRRKAKRRRPRRDKRGLVITASQREGEREEGCCSDCTQVSDEAKNGNRKREPWCVSIRYTYARGTLTTVVKIQ